MSVNSSERSYGYQPIKREFFVRKQIDSEARKKASTQGGSDAVTVRSRDRNPDSNEGRHYGGIRGRGPRRSEENKTPPPTNTPPVTPPPTTGGEVVTTQPVGNPIPISAAPAPGVTPPAAPVAEVPINSDLQSLAQKYVQNYEQQTKQTLTDDKRTQLVGEVYSFYSDPTRAGRLKTLVEAGA